MEEAGRGRVEAGRPKGWSGVVEMKDGALIEQKTLTNTGRSFIDGFGSSFELYICYFSWMFFRALGCCLIKERKKEKGKETEKEKGQAMGKEKEKDIKAT